MLIAADRIVYTNRFRPTWSLIPERRYRAMSHGGTWWTYDRRVEDASGGGASQVADSAEALEWLADRA